jgi:hypothetical protein
MNGGLPIEFPAGIAGPDVFRSNSESLFLQLRAGSGVESE